MAKKNKDEKYFNFPVMLLSGFMENSILCLNNIADYCFYRHAIDHYDYGDYREMIVSAKKYFVFAENGQETRQFHSGCELFRETPNAPKVGLNLSVYWDFYKNDKSEEEKACLLAFLAIKSILGQGNKKKPYCKVTNNYLLARMDGRAKSVESVDELHPILRKYAKEYWLKKIKNVLREHWGLSHYSRYTRGFYVSFTMPEEELMYQVEKNRKSRLDKQKANEQKAALARVMERLNNELS